ncbi:hypothetical protein [Dyadobacter sp. Leaf189]|uniref:hypothetical protein n=1 Tax=Dyadobacter sp. Leaf189 TaxID=1736295 RepID=UPI0006F5D6B3|nr:hypothetical protein [Dyadobacter sp. Leaf189]KQS23880.1 hypothetical protein ASG33_25030 [Dyadobacter sp. Leaf189]
MKKLFKVFVCSLFVIISTLSCNNERDALPARDKAQIGKASSELKLLRVDANNLSQETAAEAAADLLLFINANLVSPVKKRNLSSIEILKLQKTKSEQDLREFVNQAGGDPDRVFEAIREFQKIAQYLETEKVNTNSFAHMLVKQISIKSLNKRFANMKFPNCPGMCSQQFNIDMASCENELVLEIGGSLAAGIISGGMAGAAGLIVSVSLYFNCENTAFDTLGTCSAGC